MTPGARIFTGGAILTMRPEAPRAEAIAFAGDRILAVGGRVAVRAAAPGAEEIDVQGGCIVPGFIDAHQHFSEGAFFGAAVNLHWPAVHTVADVLEALRRRAAETPAGGWVLGEGYSEAHLEERRGPTLDELDAACPDHPVLLVQYSYHEAIVNPRAHEVVGLPLRRPDPPGGEIETDRSGRPTGRLIENAVAPFYVRAVSDGVAHDEAGYFDLLARYQERLFASGITRVYDAAVPPLMEGLLRRAAEKGLLRLPVLMMLSSRDGMFLPPWDRLSGPVTGDGVDPLRTGPLKLFLDGGERAAMSLPLAEAMALSVGSLRRALRRRSLAPVRAFGGVPARFDWASRRVRSGIRFYAEATLRELIKAASRRGLSVAAHAEGNEAIEQALRVLPRAPRSRAPGVCPPRIEHFFFPDPEAIPRAAELEVAVAVQPSIVSWTGDRLLDLGIVPRRPFTPIRSLLDAGLTVAGSSDAPVVDFDPLLGLRAAVTRTTTAGEPLGDGQEIRAEEALALYTVHAARSGGLEHEVGTLEPGKRADLVVLDADPTTLAPAELGRLAVVRTISGGDEVYRRATG